MSLYYTFHFMYHLAFLICFPHPFHIFHFFTFFSLSFSYFFSSYLWHFFSLSFSHFLNYLFHIYFPYLFLIFFIFLFLILFIFLEKLLMRAHLLFNGRRDIELPLLQHNIVRLNLLTTTREKYSGKILEKTKVWKI